MINNEIKSDVVNVVQENGKGLIKMKLTDAIKIAEEQGYDVICINTNGDIPVVKIANYGKFQYEKSKKEKENKKKARLNAQQLKEIIISDSIAKHDLEIKAKNADRIINEGDKVKLTIKYRGRTVRLINNGPEMLQNLVEMMHSNYNIDKTPKIEGNKVSMVISPKKK